MDAFTQALTAIEAEYLPHIQAAREELARLEENYNTLVHVAAVEYGYTNEVIEALKAGQEVFVHHYHDGECYLSVNGVDADVIYDSGEYIANDNDPLSVAFITAIDYGLIVEGEGSASSRNVPFTLTPPYPR